MGCQHSKGGSIRACLTADTRPVAPCVLAELRHFRITSRKGMFRTRSRNTLQDEPCSSVPAAKVALHSKCGFKRGKFGDADQMINQDRGLVTYPLAEMNDHMMIAVFDGHGTYGDCVSERAAVTLVEEYEDHLGPDETTEEALKRAMCATNSKLRAMCPSMADKSGTTAVIAVVSSSTITVGCVGDSRCILGTSQADKKGWEAVPLSVEHTPSRREEAARIEASGGDVIQCTGEERIRNGTGCTMAVSRAIGDWIFSDCGVICEPDIQTWELSEDDRCLILASDGLWTFVTPQV